MKEYLERFDMCIVKFVLYDSKSDICIVQHLNRVSTEMFWLYLVQRITPQFVGGKVPSGFSPMVT